MDDKNQSKVIGKNFENIFNHAAEGILLAEVGSKKFYIGNPAICQMLGYTKEEIGKLGIMDIHPQKDVPYVLEQFKKQAEGKIKLAKDLPLKKKDGTIFFADVNASPITIDGKNYLMGFFHDNTKRKKAEDELIKYRKTLEDRVERRTKQLENTKAALLNVLTDSQEANARSEAILASIAVGVVVVNRSGIITLMNNAAEKILGWTVQESVGKKWFQILKKEDKDGNSVSPENGAIKAALTSTVITTASEVANPYFYVRKNGTKFPVTRTVSPIIIGGKVSGAVNVFRDVTEEKELDTMKDEFMDIAAHDMRTPASAIRGFVSRVLDGDAGKISDKARELLKYAYEGNLRMIKLVDDFLTVSRLERGKIKIVTKTGDLAKIIETSVNVFSGLAGEKGLTLEYKKSKLPAVLIDEERTRQVVNNLIENAIKFTEKGGITINHTINKDEVVTNVTDTGMGISPDSQKQLFQKYYKGEEAASQSGLGLGLYISRLCVEGSGGKIWVESKEGKGSTFSFSLSIAK
jgi:PAS domain S-box-containing protein